MNNWISLLIIFTFLLLSSYHWLLPALIPRSSKRSNHHKQVKPAIDDIGERVAPVIEGVGQQVHINSHHKQMFLLLFHILCITYNTKRAILLRPKNHRYIGQLVIFSIQGQTWHRGYIFILPLTNADLTSGRRLGGRFGGHCERVSDVQGAPRS